eukprot:CAMPEP_0194129474 /NCGR_PEP_ID=MMETSP0152-20130528/681_1 /TAXON_ID=1049557 /ORGANISM="Thalassiothrix antarctica, Strain L6-D1" /LENGTH=249 /DNA_ID=CAMNT_0038823665 /DNA_START=41 /DNA_END=790 /DNA_ORIENTATION=-
MKVTAALFSLLCGSAVAFAPSSESSAKTSSLNAGTDDLRELAKKCNPVVQFYDPIGLSNQRFWGSTSDQTIGFLREAEVKHGRIAMFAFVGYIVHANGITWPWPMQLDGTPFPKTNNAPEAWDAISDEAKLQIFLFIGFLEYYREVAGDKHYMRGGKPGDFPKFDPKVIPGGALNLYDPFNFANKRTEEEKEQGLIKELNNGRLAMLGIFGFISEGKIEGSVPVLKGIIPPYTGEIMAPLTKSILPFHL